jgi:hypothetical protein
LVVNILIRRDRDKGLQCKRSYRDATSVPPHQEGRQVDVDGVGDGDRVKVGVGSQVQNEGSP